MSTAGGRIVFAVCLALVLVLAVGSAQAQTLASAAPAPPASPAPMPLQIRQTAYLKASNPHASDHFADGGNLPSHSGNSIAVSQDGTYIAVGAHQESSAAKGINGNQNDTSLYASGAVYVFVRRGGTYVQQAYIKPSNPQQGANFGMNVVFNAAQRIMVMHQGRTVIQAKPDDVRNSAEVQECYLGGSTAC